METKKIYRGAKKLSPSLSELSYEKSYKYWILYIRKEEEKRSISSLQSNERTRKHKVGKSY